MRGARAAAAEERGPEPALHRDHRSAHWVRVRRTRDPGGIVAGWNLVAPIDCGGWRTGRAPVVPYTHAPAGWWRDFVSASPARTAKLAVVRANGSPHVVPVWVDLDGDEIVFTTAANTVKGKAILRDPRVSLCWDDERPPFSLVTIAGTAAVSRDPETLLAWATRIGGRYMGAERAEEYGRRNAVPPEMVVRVAPSKIVARVNIAD